MDLFQAFKTQVQTHVNQQKSKKIYVFNSRKSTNLNQKKLNELVHVNNLSPHKYQQSVLQGSIRKYLTEQRKESNMFALLYKQEQQDFNIRQKRRQITNKIISNFHISGFKNKNDHQKQRSKQTKSQRHNDQKSLTSQIQPQKSCNNYPKPNRDQDTLFLVQPKKNSLPHLNKRSISFSDPSNHTPTKPNKSRTPLGDYSSQHDDIQFLRTGVISGLKIQKSPTKQKYKTSKPQTYELQKPLFNSQSQPDKLAQEYYSLIRKTDYRKMTKSVGKKVIRNSFLEIKRRRSSQKQAMKITQLHGKSLIKLEEIMFNNRKIELKV